MHKSVELLVSVGVVGFLQPSSSTVVYTGIVVCPLCKIPPG